MYIHRISDSGITVLRQLQNLQYVVFETNYIISVELTLIY
jgi:hypothetical protein